MAMIEDRQAVGPRDEVGSLETGKQADLLGVDLTAGLGTSQLARE